MKKILTLILTFLNKNSNFIFYFLLLDYKLNSIYVRWYVHGYKESPIINNKNNNDLNISTNTKGRKYRIINNNNKKLRVC